MTIFIVAGIPVTQGSKRAFVVNGKACLVESSGDRLKLWRHAMNDGARDAQDGPPRTGPVTVAAHFSLVRPKSHPKRRTWPTGGRSGDLDKLARAVLDSLTGVCFIDDAQVVRLNVTKDWAIDGRPGVEIVVSDWEEPQ